jgi:pimeloyl-ACP methyl ester carboxylesterase
MPEKRLGSLVIFVHGSGSSQFSSRNEYIADVLNRSGISTLIVNLLSTNESEIDSRTQGYRFDIELLTNRLLTITDAMIPDRDMHEFKFGYLGSSTGSAAAVKAAIQRSQRVKTIVSRAGRLDLVDPNSLAKLTSSILILVGGEDHKVTENSFKLMPKIKIASSKKIIQIPGASHLFSEPGKIELVARIASAWFIEKLS